MDFNILFLSLIQGISEILPISSSVNLYFFSHIFDIKVFSFSLKIALHVGSLIALLVYFKSEIIDIFKGFFGNKKISDTYFWSLLFGTLPVAIFGYISRNFVKEFDSAAFMGIASIIFGILLVLFDRLVFYQRFSDKGPVSPLKSFVIGCCQTIAIFPGVSRLGICITASRMLQLSRKRAINFSLMLAIPSISGSLVLELVECYKSNNFYLFSTNFLTGTLVTAVISLVAIIPCVRFMDRLGFGLLALYRIIIGAAICFL